MKTDTIDLPEDLLEGFADLFLGRGEAFDLNVRALAHEHQYAFETEFTEPLQVDRLAVDRREVYLEVTRMDYRSDRRLKCDRICVRDAVVYSDELDIETVAELYMVAVLALFQPDAFEAYALFFELVANEFDRQRAAVDRALELS